MHTGREWTRNEHGAEQCVLGGRWIVNASGGLLSKGVPPVLLWARLIPTWCVQVTPLAPLAWRNVSSSCGKCGVMRARGRFQEQA